MTVYYTVNIQVKRKTKNWTKKRWKKLEKTENWTENWTESDQHTTLLAGHRGAGKTLSRVQQEFYWRGKKDYVTRYVRGTYQQAQLQRYPLVIAISWNTIFNDLCGKATTPYHVMGNGVIENFYKTIKNLLKIGTVT